jgi:hydrogenase expression/formation protein HypE
MDNPKKTFQLQCPMPKLDFDIITLGHGSGGLLTNRLLDQGVFDLLSNDILDRRHDGAFLELSGATAFTTDSFVISPVFFPGGDIGDLAINGTVNDLAMCGAIPKYLSLSFIIEEGLTIKDFWEILVSIKYASEKAGVKIVTGDTKVVERGKGDQIFINTAGIGSIHPKASINAKNIRAGDQIILSGPVATHGMAIMSVREGLSFETDIISDTQGLNHVVSKLLDRFGSQIKWLRDPTRGGLASSFNELAKDISMGIDLIQKNIPVDEQVYSACEILGIDPYYVANEGIFISIVAPEIAGDYVQMMRDFEETPKAAIIGSVGNEHPRQVLLQSAIGGKRVLNMAIGEQLPRIC